MIIEMIQTNQQRTIFSALLGELFTMAEEDKELPPFERFAQCHVINCWGWAAHQRYRPDGLKKDMMAEWVWNDAADEDFMLDITKEEHFAAWAHALSGKVDNKSPAVMEFRKALLSALNP